MIDLLVALLPDVFIDQVLRQLALVHQVVDAGDDHVLILGPIENPDAPAAGERLIDAPQEIVIPLLDARLLESLHLHPRRIQRREDMIDGAVLARRVHGLQDHDEAVRILGVQLFLELLHLLDGLREIISLHLRLLHLHIAGRGIVRERHPRPLTDAIPLDVHLFFHSNTSWEIGLLLLL